jgi:peptide/nickel transport system substrate-binding protein
VVESQSEGTEDADILQLIAHDWKKIGIRLLVRTQTRENLRLRNSAGETLMTVFVGQVTAMPSPDTSPWGYAPTRQGGLQWPKWGLYFESKGTQGEKCDMPEACKLLDYVKEWEHAPDTAGRRKAWEKILQTNADEVFSIGTVNGVRQPLVVSAKIRNVPKEGYYAWDPSGFFGLYQPATFWVAP